MRTGDRVATQAMSRVLAHSSPDAAVHATNGTAITYNGENYNYTPRQELNAGWKLRLTSDGRAGDRRPCARR
jgi:asparagine synthetase B (glutamine-hydrolysing)